MEIRFFTDRVYDFLYSLSPVPRSRVAKGIALLGQYGNELRYPHTKKVTAGIFELRVHGDKSVRIFFTFHRSRAVILHAFVKKTDKIPPRELEKAKRLYSMLLQDK
ncbi:MAG: type II toxin-antitoxin system RelE/ParE family toxin [bacterium]|nr:type II toxin-antitoxin system RelE/ParE family toxin [bacterium]